MSVPIEERQRRISDGQRLSWKRRKERCDALEKLCRELDMEMDGAAIPHSAAAILNAIRRLLQ